VGSPVTPEQTQSGTWEVFQVTSRTVLPVTEVTSEVQQALLQTTANRNRVSNEVLAFAKTSSVQVNPQYGTWTKAQIVPPASPAPRYLLPTYASTTTTPVIASSGSGASPSSSGSSTSTTTAG
jgi:hypothetical protein